MRRLNMQPRQVLRWCIGIGCVALAWALLQVLPSEDAGQKPFTVAVEIGESGEGRALSATVTDVVLADALVNGGWRVEANWLVVDLEVMGLVKESGSLLSHTMLVVGDRSYRASERPPNTLLRELVLVGIPRAGTLAFELPANISGSATLQLALGADPRLDSMIVVDLDLDELPRVPEREYERVGWGSL